MRECGTRLMIMVSATGLLLATLAGCPGGEDGSADDRPIYSNTTDPTNGGARYLGSTSCRACHPTVDTQQSLHGHAHVLTRIEGLGPRFPEMADRADVPAPPDGFAWTDIPYVVGGYTRRANFIDADGYVLVTGLAGVPTQWNQALLADGSEPGFVDYEPERTERKPYGDTCFRCHTTGAQPQDEEDPAFQESRPGFLGTWQEAGVQCEACHGPGARHITNPDARDLFVDVSAAGCGRCHDRPFGNEGRTLAAQDGYIASRSQYAELRASGGHAEFACVTCHDPHVSVNYQRDSALRKTCEDCHPGVNMALHRGRTYERGDYTEPVTCISCHMPFASRSATAAGPEVVGESGRMADLRTHVFRVDTRMVDYTAMFTEDGSQVRKDAQERAAVTVDFVCLRCHNDKGNAFGFDVFTAGDIANLIHTDPAKTGSPQ